MEDLLKVFWKTIITFVVLVVLSRIMGKKLLSQMTFFDFVVGVVMGAIGGAFIVDEVHSLWAMLGPVILTILAIGVALLTVKSLPARKFAGR